MEKMSKKKVVKEQNEKKLIVKFLISLICCTALGFVAGLLGAHIKNMNLDFSSILSKLRMVTVYAMPAILILTNLVAALISFAGIKKAKKLYQGWDGEDEVTDALINDCLDKGTVLSNIMTILSMFFYAVGVCLMDDMELGKHFWILFVVNTVGLVAGLAWGIIAQKQILALIKAMNPEKHGSIFDTHFAEKWEQCCDEAERMMQYKAGYAAFKSTQATCLILWIVCFALDVPFETGLFPLVIVTVIWLVCTVSYMKSALKQERAVRSYADRD